MLNRHPHRRRGPIALFVIDGSCRRQQLPEALVDPGHLDGRHRQDEPLVPSRLTGAFLSETWSDHFDIVVVIGRASAPTFDPWK